MEDYTSTDKVNVDLFFHQVESMHRRLEQLYQRSINLPLPPTQELLSVSFKELGTASEELQVAMEVLKQQNEELIVTRALLEAERQRYQDLFEFGPDAYLVTNTQGIIQETNLAAAQLLNVPQHYLIGKSLSIFIVESERQAFRSALLNLDRGEQLQEWKIRFCPRKAEPFDAVLRIVTVRSPEGQPVALRIGIRERINRLQTKVAIEKNNCDLQHNRPVHVYSRGETIPFNPEAIWLVSQGVVKLTTLTETADEVMLGLVGPSSLFGSSLTALPIYQATALSEVKLVSIPLSEIAETTLLAQTLLPKIAQRLQQTESFLTISGQRRVQDRFQTLLRLLKQEIGQPVASGVRLNVRLTHQDLADACCTTRVTITRLLGKLQRQGLIAVDVKNHLILKETVFNSTGTTQSATG